MNGNSSKKDLGINYSCDFDAFTWKISNISSVPHIIDYVVQSPSFSFDGSSWILKMYPYGRTAKRSEGYIDVILERLHYQDPKQKISFEIFCEDVYIKKFCGRSQTYVFNSPISTQLEFFKFTESLKDNPEKWRIAPYDTFRIVVSFKKRNQRMSPTDSGQTKLGKRFKNKENPEIGEILKEYAAFTEISVKRCNIEIVPAGSQIRDPEQFSLADASWVLKIYPYFRMENSEKQSFDVVLERLHSKIPEHNVMLEFHTTFPSHVGSVEKSLFFNSNHTTGDAFNLQYEKCDNKWCLHYTMTMRVKTNTGKSDSQTKSNQSIEGDSGVSGSSAVLQNFKKLYLQQEDCDVLFKVKGKEFSAHRLILKAQSPVLASAFRINMKEKATGIFNVEDCEPSIFSDFLHFLYCGEVTKLSKDNVFGLFTVADKYDVSNLRVMCTEFIKRNLSVETFCDTVALALLHSEADLLQFSTDFFVKNLKEIIVTVKWQSFVVENPIQGNELIVKALVFN